MLLDRRTWAHLGCRLFLLYGASACGSVMGWSWQAELPLLFLTQGLPRTPPIAPLGLVHLGPAQHLPHLIAFRSPTLRTGLGPSSSFPPFASNTQHTAATRYLAALQCLGVHTGEDGGRSGVEPPEARLVMLHSRTARSTHTYTRRTSSCTFQSSNFPPPV